MYPTYSTSLHINKVGKESERTRQVMKGNRLEENYPINEKQSLGKTEASCTNRNCQSLVTIKEVTRKQKH